MSNLSFITVTILTKNSARYLRQCLDALKDVAEVIVLDNGSTDATLTIAAAFPGVKIVKHSFSGFGQMKNLAASYANNDWILSIDSDEIASPELLEEIQSLSLDENAVYRILRKNYYRQKHIAACGWNNDRVIRLYHRKNTSFADKSVHEVISTSGLKILDLKGFLHHYPFYNISQLIGKLEHYTTLFAEENRFKKRTTPLKAYVKKIFHFSKDYFFGKGFMYGYEGLAISMSNANGSFYKHMKLYEANLELGISLIVTTYKRKDALEVVLLSILKQSLLPKEVIIADDGSGEDTKRLIDRYKAEFPVPLLHCWQADEGFRAAKIRNKAMALATQEYIVMIDGDIVLHPNFLKNHQKVAQKGAFIQGSRVLLSERLTEKVLQFKTTSVHFLQKGFKNRLNALYIPFLIKIMEKKSTSLRGIRSCNMAVWREDVMKVNGFNEAFIGWGREDSEFAVRLINNGIMRKKLKFGGIGYHLHHVESSKKMLPENDRILEEAIRNKAKTCEKGINQYINK